MKKMSWIAALAALILIPAAVLAGDAVNGTCPVGKMPIDGKTFTKVDDKKVGFCCGKCRGEFDGWSDDAKKAFVLTSLQSKGSEAAKAKGEARTEKATGDPYPLAKCPVSGYALGSMSGPVVKSYDGREIRFCCNSCIAKFEAAKETFTAKIDEKIIASQKPLYPTDRCVVMGDPLEGGEEPPIDYVYKNRLVRLCCKMCARKLEKRPERYLEELDAAVVKAQDATYPFDTCPVSGHELGSMGDPVKMVVGNRLVKLCCASCKGKLSKEPAEVLAKVDAAREKSSK